MRRVVVALVVLGAVLAAVPAASAQYIDGDADSLECGAGENDRAVIRPGDSTSNCEVVRAIS